jgi:3-oxoacyl-[acyl-carrier protein] reductase
MADRMVEAGTAIVTGGAGGIGKATVRRLLDMGLSVFIVDADEKSIDAGHSVFGP